MGSQDGMTTTTDIAGKVYHSSYPIRQACFFTDFPAIQDNGISLILSLEEKSLSLGRKSLSLEKNTGVYGGNPPV